MYPTNNSTFFQTFNFNYYINTTVKEKSDQYSKVICGINHAIQTYRKKFFPGQDHANVGDNEVIDKINYDRIQKLISKNALRSEIIMSETPEVLKDNPYNDKPFRRPLFEEQNLSIIEQEFNAYLIKELRKLNFDYYEMASAIKAKPLINRITKAKEILKNKEKCIVYLKMIEAEFKLFCQDSLLEPNGGSSLETQNKKQKFLNYVQKWLQKNGFGELQEMNEIFSEEKFRQEYLLKKILFQDKVFPPEFHGEWPHVIQWMILDKANNDKNFLAEVTISEFYSEFSEKRVFDIDCDLWFVTFELNSDNSKDPNDFGNVISLNNFLKSNEALVQLPNLTQGMSLSAHEEKADHIQSTTLSF